MFNPTETTTSRFCLLATILLLTFTLTSADCEQQATPATPSETLPPATSTQLLTAASTAPTGTEGCLGCHAPYEKVLQATANYTLQNGTKVNPHTSMDRNASKPHAWEKKVFECMNCHKMHPLPIGSPKDVSKANVEYCFSCHHERNFTSCTQCH
jgi:hypothetical protein